MQYQLQTYRSPWASDLTTEPYISAHVLLQGFLLTCQTDTGLQLCSNRFDCFSSERRSVGDPRRCTQLHRAVRDVGAAGARPVERKPARLLRRVPGRHTTQIRGGTEPQSQSSFVLLKRLHTILPCDLPLRNLPCEISQLQKIS